ncbi:MAG TPA: AbrB family transcriptional regulator [Reyranella sp.]|nr:AbrB family transcriptional regulator [Reyranella sp.]
MTAKRPQSVMRAGRRFASARQWGALVALSIAIGGLLLWMHAPAALLLGPLLAGIVLAANGGKVVFPVSLFVVSQGVIGCLIARMVPVSIVGDILQHWQLFAIGVMAVVAASSLLGWVMGRLRLLPGTTALWGSSPGAASIMTLMAEDYGADVRLVAFMQYFRVLAVAAVAALVAHLFKVDTAAHAPSAVVWFPPVDALSLGETAALAIAGPYLARALRIPAGAFLVPMAIGIVLVHFGLMRIELPTWLLVGAYAFVGWNIGLRFTRPLLLHAARSLPVVVAFTLLLIALCGAVAGLLVAGAGVDPLTAYLATSPGGIDSVAIISAASGGDVSFVMAMQTVRLLAVLFLGPPLTKFLALRAGADKRP